MVHVAPFGRLPLVVRLATSLYTQAQKARPQGSPKPLVFDNVKFPIAKPPPYALQ
jgi:hypothetical protein